MGLVTSSLRYVVVFSVSDLVQMLMLNVQFTDEKWKDDQFGGVEGHWGLFHQKYVSCTIGGTMLTYSSSRTLKHIEIPDCIAP